MDGASYFLLPERRIATKTKVGEITLGRVVFQSRLGHEDTDGGKSRAHGTAQCLSHESFVVHLGIADVALLLAEAALLAGLPFSSVVGRGCSSKHSVCLAWHSYITFSGFLIPNTKIQKNRRNANFHFTFFVKKGPAKSMASPYDWSPLSVHTPITRT